MSEVLEEDLLLVVLIFDEDEQGAAIELLITTPAEDEHGGYVGLIAEIAEDAEETTTQSDGQLPGTHDVAAQGKESHVGQTVASPASHTRFPHLFTIEEEEELTGGIGSAGHSKTFLQTLAKPTQEYPGSTIQVAEHPSPFKRFPLSHCSNASILPFPHVPLSPVFTELVLVVTVELLLEETTEVVLEETAELLLEETTEVVLETTELTLEETGVVLDTVELLLDEVVLETVELLLEEETGGVLETAELLLEEVVLETAVLLLEDEQGANSAPFSAALNEIVEEDEQGFVVLLVELDPPPTLSIITVVVFPAPSVIV